MDEPWIVEAAVNGTPIEIDEVVVSDQDGTVIVQGLSRGRTVVEISWGRPR